MLTAEPRYQEYNKQVASFDVKINLLDGLKKVIVPRNDPEQLGQPNVLRRYVPFAEYMFNRLKGDTVRIDLSRTETDGTLISVNRKLLPVTPKEYAFVKEAIESYLNHPAFPSQLPFIQARQITDTFNVKSSYTPKTHQEKLIMDIIRMEVSAAQERDGGAMEILNVSIPNSRQAFATVAMVGSCNGCNSAGPITLANARSRVNTVLEAIGTSEKSSAEMKSIASVRLEPVNIVEMPVLILR